MLVVVGVAFVAAALVVATRSGMVAARAAAGRRIPLWRSSEGYQPPIASVLLQVGAVLLAGVGCALCFFVWGSPAILLTIPPTFLPPFVVGVLHNGSARASK